MAKARRGGGPVLTVVVGVLVALAALLGWVVWTGRYPAPDVAAIDVDVRLPEPPALPKRVPMPDPQPTPLPVPGPRTS